MAPEPIPSPIVEQAQLLAAALEQWARAHRSATLAEHETGVLALFRRFMGPTLGAVLARALGLDHPAAPHRRCACPGCGRPRRPHGWRTRRPVTVCGAAPLGRPYYWCPGCRRGWAPADAALALDPDQRLSAGVRTWLAELGGSLPFAQAAARLESLAGVGLGKETARAHAEALGTDLVLARAAAAERVLATRAAAEPVEPAPGLLVVETDGVLVRFTDGWHEVKIGEVAGCVAGNGRPAADPAHRAPRLVQPSYVAARAPVEAFGPLLLAEAARRGALDVVGWEQPPGVDPRLAGVAGPALAVLRPLELLGDGARWIWEMGAEHFGPQRIEAVDYYHAVEHLWTLGRALHGAEGPHTRTWARRAEAVLWGRGGARLVPHLARVRAPTAEAAEVLRVERGYFTTNRDRMDYPALRARGLPIGSGAVESACKHLVQLRLKRPGMRWSPAGGQAILALCARLASHRPIAPAPIAALPLARAA